MVLADDNFATIERGRAEGRRIYDNLRKSVVFLLPTNGAQSLVILVAVLFGLALPLDSGAGAVGQHGHRGDLVAGAGVRASRARPDGPTTTAGEEPHPRARSTCRRSLSRRC